MRKVAIALAALFVLAMACGGGGTPDQVVRKFIDGFENGDGNAIISCISTDAVAELEASLEEMKADPESSAAFLGMVGIETTADEIRNMDAGAFLDMMFSSELLAAELPDFGSVEVGETRIEGDNAWVTVTMDGETDEVMLVLENGNWKISADAMGGMF